MPDDSESQRRVKALFLRAAELPGSAGEAFLARACGEDAAVRLEVEDLLGAAGRAGEFLAAPTGVVEPQPPADGGRPGGVVGPYYLLERIGEGGFGAVFMAEQRRPVLRRVALKILKAGMDTEEVIARFEAERQALAMMDHPSIARVFDAGTTEAGRPYFVMELVRGEPITAWCDAQELDVRARLELFVEVCRAVQHAHQKGIIHRDLKPSNVLVSEVDGRASPKVIDFGVAKATGGARLTERKYVTELRQLVGTPEYMSPEQASEGGADMDTRSDIYSLGVLLYELLTGSPPFDAGRLRSAGWEEMRRIICEQYPRTPSARLSELSAADRSAPRTARRPPADPASRAGSAAATVAGRRRTDPKRLRVQLRGDLDWIVMKCLEKDRSRRYATANALAADVWRHLAGEPVVAAPPGRLYRARKFGARNRGLVTAAAAVAAALVLGMIGTSAGLVRALREAERAQAAEAVAEKRAVELTQMVEFQETQFAQLDAPSMGLSLRDAIADRRRTALVLAGAGDEEVEGALLDLERVLEGVNFTSVTLELLHEHFFGPTLNEVEERLADQPLVQARVLQSIATLMFQLGMWDRATGPQERALEIRMRELGDAHPETIESLVELGFLVSRYFQGSAGEPYLRQGVESARREFGLEHRLTVRAMNSLGVHLHAQGEYGESERCFREALDASSRILSDTDELVLTLVGNLAYALEGQDKESEAESCYKEAIRRRQAVLGDEHPKTLWPIQRLGVLLRAQGRLDEAEPYLVRALEGYRRVRGEEHVRTSQAFHQLGMLRREQGRFGEAEHLGAQAVESARRSLRPERPNLAWYLLRHGQALAALDRFHEAELRMLEAHNLFSANRAEQWENAAVADTFAHRLAGAFADLYDAWHAAEPEAGYGWKAMEWRIRAQAAEPVGDARGGPLLGPEHRPGG